MHRIYIIFLFFYYQCAYMLLAQQLSSYFCQLGNFYLFSNKWSTNQEIIPNRLCTISKIKSVVLLLARVKLFRIKDNTISNRQLAVQQSARARAREQCILGCTYVRIVVKQAIQFPGWLGLRFLVTQYIACLATIRTYVQGCIARQLHRQDFGQLRGYVIRPAVQPFSHSGVIFPLPITAWI